MRATTFWIPISMCVIVLSIEFYTKGLSGRGYAIKNFFCIKKMWKSEILSALLHDSFLTYRGPDDKSDLWRKLRDIILNPQNDKWKDVLDCLKDNSLKEYEIIFKNEKKPRWGRILGKTNVLPVFVVSNDAFKTCTTRVCEFKSVGQTKDRCCVSYESSPPEISYKLYNLILNCTNQCQIIKDRICSENSKGSCVDNKMLAELDSLESIDALSATSAAFFFLVDTDICDSLHGKYKCDLIRYMLQANFYSKLAPEVSLKKTTASMTKVRCGDGAIFNQHGMSTLVHCLVSLEPGPKQVVLFLNYEKTNFKEMFENSRTDEMHEKWPDVVVFRGSYKDPKVQVETREYLIRMWDNLECVNLPKDQKMQVISVEIYTAIFEIKQMESIPVHREHDDNWQTYENAIKEAMDHLKYQQFTSIVVSSGGMKMTFAGCVALNCLKKNKQLSNIKHAAGVSGGAWALSIYFTHIHDNDENSFFETFMPYYKNTQNILLNVESKNNPCNVNMIWDFVKDFHLPEFTQDLGTVMHNIQLDWKTFVEIILQPNNTEQVRTYLNLGAQTPGNQPIVCLSFGILPHAHVTANL